MGGGEAATVEGAAAGTGAGLVEAAPTGLVMFETGVGGDGDDVATEARG